MNSSSQAVVVLLLLAATCSSCEERRQNTAVTPAILTSSATGKGGSNEITSESSGVCSANRFSLPTLLGWIAQDIADDECRVRDLRKGKGRARIAICVPGEAVTDALVPHGKQKARLIQANGRDAFVQGDLTSERRGINGEVGIRFLSEHGTDWISVTAFDLAEEDLCEIMGVVLNATTQPRPRNSKGKAWEHASDFAWDEYIAECWRVRDLLSGKDPALASVPRFGRVKDAVAALLNQDVASKP
jgi:hypothetical protein